MTTKRTAVEQTTLSQVVHQLYSNGQADLEMKIYQKSLWLSENGSGIHLHGIEKDFPDSGFHMQICSGFRNPDSLTQRDCYPQFYSGLFAHLDFHIPPTHDMVLRLKPFAKYFLIVLLIILYFSTFLF